jgi:hypothetical protein
MKTFKYLLCAFLAGAMTFISCKKDPESGPELASDLPEVAAVEGKIVVVLNCADNAKVCNGLVFAGDYNGYSTDVAQMAAFTPIKGRDGWYKAEITPAETPSKEGVALEGKPCQLASDGTFPGSWDYQWYAKVDANGDVEKKVEVLKGSATLEVEYSTEFKLVVAAGETVVYVKTYAWKKDACIPTEKYTITFNATVPAALHDTDVVYIVGSINSWTADATPMTKGENNVWTTTLDGVEYDAEYKYLLNGSWDFEELAAKTDTCANSISNRRVVDRTMDDTVDNFKIRTANLCPKDEE